MWATPLTTTPDPVKISLNQLWEEKTKREEIKEQNSKKEHTGIKWAYPIATVGNDKQEKYHHVRFAGERHVTWSDPIATIAEPNQSLFRKALCFEGERVLFSKKFVNGKLVWTGKAARVLGIEGSSLPLEEMDTCPYVPCVKGGATTAMTPLTVASSPSIGVQDSSPAPREDWYQCPEVKGEPTTVTTSRSVASSPSSTSDQRAVTDLEAMVARDSDPAAEALEFAVKRESRASKLIRKWGSELKWLCNFDQEPLTVEEQMFLYRQHLLRQRRLRKLRKSSPEEFRPEPWYAYALVCCWTVVLLGGIILVFL